MKETNKVDRRVIKTKKQLRYALAMLLKEKKLDDIKVSELTAYVNINRGTFYQHYKDVRDLEIQIEDEIYNDYINMINQSEEEFAEFVKTEEQLRELNIRYITKLLNYIKENNEIFESLFGPNGDPEFSKRIKDLVSEKWLKRRSQSKPVSTNPLYPYIIEYVASGMISILTMWIQTGLQEPAADMAKLILDTVTKGILETING